VAYGLHEKKPARSVYELARHFDHFDSQYFTTDGDIPVLSTNGDTPGRRRYRTEVASRRPEESAQGVDLDDLKS